MTFMPWTTGGFPAGLTLNLGLRWEGLPHAYDTENNTANFYPNLYNPANAAQFLPNGALNTSGPGFSTVPDIALSSQRST